MKEEFLTLDDFLIGRNWPKSKNSLRHLIKKHKNELLEKRVLVKFDRLWFINPVKFDEFVFKTKKGS